MKTFLSHRALPVLLAGALGGLSLAALAQAPVDRNAVPGVSSGPAGNGLRADEPVRMAQSSSSSAPSGFARSDGYSLLPYTRKGYVGINVGRSSFKNGCGNGLYGCDNPDVGMSVYTGGLVNEWFGVELGYMHTGTAHRAGGDTSAQGVNMSLVARAPMGPVNVFAKGGAVYAQTKVSTGVLSDVPSGKRSGFGGIYGAGVGYDFTPVSGVVLEWSRSELRFPGVDDRQSVDTASVGYVHRF
jgi:hypothetical protein